MAETSEKTEGKEEPPSQGAEMTVNASEFAAYLKWKETQEKEQSKSSEPSSKRQKQVEEDDDDIKAFVAKLAERDIEVGDMDPELLQQLKSSKRARDDFLTVLLQRDTMMYNTQTGSFESEQAMPRPASVKPDPTTPTIAIGDDVQKAMEMYHSTTVLPNVNKLYELCDNFYSHVTAEFGMQQYALDRLSTQVASLEKSRCNKTILLQELPPTTSKRVVDSNMDHYFQQAGIKWEDVAAIHNHQVSAAHSVVRVEFLTEAMAAHFKDEMRKTRKYWRDSNYADHRVRFEADMTTEDRLAMQPFYAMLDILKELFPSPTYSDIQNWRQTLQRWTPREAPEQQLLAQIAYVLDKRFDRRYSCVLLLHESVYDAVLSRFHAKFAARMRATMMLVQALKRAISDKSTSSRPSYDKALDLSNADSILRCFPFPIFPNKMSSELAVLLESHPMLPFQGAGGLLSVVQQTFQDYGFDPEERKGVGKGKGKIKNKGQSKGKGKPMGKGQQASPKGAWKERDHDKRTDWRKDDDDHQDDSWGTGWPSLPSNPRGKGNTSNKGKSKSTKDRSPKGGKKGQKSKVFEVKICEDCSCALGLNSWCSTCRQADVPPGFEYREPRNVTPLVCPGENDQGKVCYNALGLGKNCDLCKEHRKYWSSLSVMTNWPTLTTDRKCQYLQLDRILYDTDILTEEPAIYEAFFEQMQKRIDNTPLPDLTPEQWAAVWMTDLLEQDTLDLLPLPKSTKLEWTIPNWDITSEGLIVMAGSLDDHILRATFYTATWFEQYIKHFWKSEGPKLVERFNMGKWTHTFDVAHCSLIPWDNLIAASFSQAYSHAKTEQADPPDLGWTKELLAWLLLGTWAKVTTDLFQVLAEEFVQYLDYDDTLKACVLGQDPFSNKGVSTSAGFGSLFFDGIFWQIAEVYGVLKDKRSIMQAPNDELVLLLEYIVPLLQISKQDVQYVRSRAHVNKGNIMETLLLALAEGGAHWLTWKTAWAMFQHRHRSAKYDWVKQVAVF